MGMYIDQIVPNSNERFPLSDGNGSLNGESSLGFSVLFANYKTKSGLKLKYRACCIDFNNGGPTLRVCDLTWILMKNEGVTYDIKQRCKAQKKSFVLSANGLVNKLYEDIIYGKIKEEGPFDIFSLKADIVFPKIKEIEIELNREIGGTHTILSSESRSEFVSGPQGLYTYQSLG